MLSENAQSSGRWLWCDHISMNQLDVEERNHQVSLISRIYSNVEMVFAYIGPEQPEEILDTQAFTSNALHRLLDGCKIIVVLTLLDITH